MDIKELLKKSWVLISTSESVNPYGLRIFNGTWAEMFCPGVFNVERGRHRAVRLNLAG